MIEPFDWHRIIFTDETPPAFMFEVVARTVFMFIALLLVLKVLSKRGVKQMSVFELALLIALGSATGDPMFYNHVSPVHCLIVILLVIGVYKAITIAASKHEYIEEIVEGKPVCLLRDGVIDFQKFKNIHMAKDKFFSLLREQKISQLGQLSRIYMETSGDLSIFIQKDEEVKPGLSLFPEDLEKKSDAAMQTGKHACVTCGITEELKQGEQKKCTNCDDHRWIVAKEEKIIR